MALDFRLFTAYPLDEVVPMAAHLQIAEWLEGEPAGDFATPTPRVTLRPAPEPVPSIRSPSSPSVPLGGLELLTARELARRRSEEDRPPPLPTAVPELDRLLEGGLARGRLVELVGERSSGRFSLILALLAAATQAGEAAALVDLGDGLDPAGAAAAGVELPRLLWVRPPGLRQALAGAEMLVATGFPLVVVELGMPPVPGAGALRGGGERAWLRLARAARTHDAALVVSSPYRASGAAAAAVLAARAEPRYLGDGCSPLLLGGLDTRVRLEKARGRSPGATEILRHRTAA
jgi:hypothetical protein